MISPARKRHRWLILIGIIVILGLCGFLVGRQNQHGPYQFLFDLGPRISGEDEHDGGNSFVGTRSRYFTLVFPAEKSATVITAVEAKLKVSIDHHPPTVLPPTPGYAHYFTDTSGSYVAVEVCDRPSKLVFAGGSLRTMTFGECCVNIDQPNPPSGFVEGLKRFFHLRP